MPTTADPPTPNTPEAAAGNQGSITNLISGILDDGKTLARQQMEMFKSEVREDIQQSIRAAEFGSIGLAGIIVGALALITAIAYFLHEQAHLSMWVSWGILGLVFLGGGVALALVSRGLLNRFNPLPDKTLNAVKENLTWNQQK